MLEGAVQAFQDTHPTHLSNPTAHPLTEGLAEVLEVAGSEVRTGVTLDTARPD
ncbi:MAG TPA: hypothetical protein PK880_05890 [Candidatus Competibacter sp.]|nr:hypothetical protein [Candidatus Competibacter sp.]